ncbi:MAG: penicillin-binding transpeptidase domain-containing protein, partial [Ferruginibacter sp.]
QCGIKTKLPPYPSIALGAAEIPMLEMLQAFTMFPNKGYNTVPVFLNRIEDKNGNLLQDFPIAQSKQVIGEADAYTMVKMMQGVIAIGTARRINSYKIDVEKAGKTGTTNGNTDGWFIGYTPELLGGTWVGCEDPFIPIYQNNGGGAEMSAPNWGLFMSKVYADKKLEYGRVTKFEEPAELKNDPIYADANFMNIANSGDSLTEDNGNGDAGDFFNDGSGKNDFFKDKADDIIIKKNDTSKTQDPKKDDGKDPKVKLVLNKPEEKKPPVKQKSGNDY